MVNVNLSFKSLLKMRGKDNLKRTSTSLKKVFAVLLILVIIANFAGAFFWFQLARSRNNTTQKNWLGKTQEYEIVYLSFQDFQKYKTPGKNEVNVEGEMYDYSKIDSLETDTVKLYAVRDHFEEFLMHTFSKIMEKKHSEEAQKNANYSQQYLSGFVFEVVNSSTVPTQNFTVTNFTLTKYGFNLSLSDLFLKSPPPKV